LAGDVTEMNVPNAPAGATRTICIYDGNNAGFCCSHVRRSPFNSEGALERAKRSVEQHYAVVGVLEDFNVTLTVFEHYVPRFFKGASDVYYGNDDYYRNRARRIHPTRFSVR